MLRLFGQVSPTRRIAGRSITEVEALFFAVTKKTKQKVWKSSIAFTDIQNPVSHFPSSQ